jgi:predicted TIM-barrel fold metal-dependent hydrolase
VAVTLGALALLALLLFMGPLGPYVDRLFETGLVRDLMKLPAAGKLAVLAVGGLLCVALAWWLQRRRERRYLAVLLIAMSALGLAYGAHTFRASHPRADLFSVERWRDISAIVLGKDTGLARFEPQPTLSVAHEPKLRAAFPVIDIHFHLGSLPSSITPERLVAAMDAAGIGKVVNLDGSADVFERFERDFHARYPERFVMFVKPNLGAALRPGGPAGQVQWIDQAARRGARGVKVNKSLGLGVRDRDGRLVAIDDPRFDPIWSEAARLGMPVLMHTADPPAFFLPVNQKNERFEELTRFPQWSNYGPENPSFEELMAQRERLLARHPRTIFIGAHIGSNEEDLAYAASLLERFPNYYVDMSARVAALGRQPYTARAFFIRYQDRILFGSDGGFGLDPDKDWTPERFYRSHFEFLETYNEYIDYPLSGVMLQGRWRVHGIGLPMEVLEKIYRRNAERLLPSGEFIAARLGQLKASD